MQRKILFMIGGPGSGKGTMSNILHDELKYHPISTGELVRARLKQVPDSDEAKMIRETTQNGGLLSGEYIMKLLREEMQSDRHRDAEGFVIDGCPRNMQQAVEFERTIGRCDHMINLEVPDDVLVSRILARAKIEGRSDDNPETVMKRLRTFHEETEAVIGYYRQFAQDRFLNVDGVGDIKVVGQRILDALGVKPAVENDHRECRRLAM